VTFEGEATVEVRTPASAALIPTIRAVASDLAARADFDLDAVADLKMAVDEACSTVATLALPEDQLRCRLQVDPDRITVAVRLPAPALSAIPQDTFGWRVLMTLADEVEVLDEDGYCIGIRLVKVRQVGGA
jgi:serine/threonine-protein kinase RsbW